MFSSVNSLSPHQLKTLVSLGLWKDSSEIWKEIAFRSMDLGLEQAELGEEFWSFNHGEEGAQFQLFQDLFNESIGAETIEPEVGDGDVRVVSSASNQPESSLAANFPETNALSASVEPEVGDDVVVASSTSNEPEPNVAAEIPETNTHKASVEPEVVADGSGPSPSSNEPEPSGVGADDSETNVRNTSDDSSESSVESDYGFLYDDVPVMARMPSEESNIDWINEVDMNEVEAAINRLDEAPEPTVEPDSDDDDEEWFTEDEWRQRGGAMPEDDQPGPSNGGRAVVSERYRQHVKRFGTTGVAYDVRFENLDQERDIEALARDTIQRQIDEVRRDGNPGDKLGIQISHPSLKEPVLVPFRDEEEHNADTVMHLIEKVAQSKKEFKVDEGFTMKFTHIHSPQGSGGGVRTFRGNFMQWLENKSKGHGSCFVKIENKDNLCLTRSLATARAHLHRNDDGQGKGRSWSRWETIRKGDKERHTAQREEARRLMHDAGLDGHQGPCGIPELQKLQEALPDYQIKVWSKIVYCALWFQGPPKEKVLHLFHYDNHYIVISSVTGFLERAYWCEQCSKGFDHKEEHICQNKCSGCLGSPPCQQVTWMNCTDCNRFFLSQQCYENHKSNVSVVGARGRGAKERRIIPVCERLKRCKKCGKLLEKDHKCGTHRCPICAEMVESGNHQCYIQPLKPPKKQKKGPPTFIFFDFETQQTKEMKQNDYGSVYEHETNCCISWKVCRHDCWKKPEDPCPNCGNDKIKEYMGDKTLEDFCEYLFSPQNKGCSVIAHNGRAYDAQFLLKYIHEQGRQPTIINRGLDILVLEFEDIRVIDSLSFLPFPLAAMPKAFNLDSFKGHFPHFFNTPENWDYEGDLPDAYYYGPGGMKPKPRDDFYKWHIAEKKDMDETGRKFKLKVELPKYCKMDVKVLLLACMTFRELFMAVTNGVDPLSECITIASACNRVYRRNFLEPNTIGIVPDGGYGKKDKQSVFALKYIKYVAERVDLASEGKFLQHAGNGGEMKIGKYKVDAALKTLEGVDLKKVCEVNGCAYHGCRGCYKDPNTVLIGGMTAGELYQRTLDKIKFLKDEGYEVDVVWECDIRKKMKEEPEMKEFFDSCGIQDPIDARDAFFGGRTNATRLFLRCKRGHKIFYVDVCSLYPWVCKFGEFPLGHPVIITENFKQVDKDNKPYRGIMKCKVLPPRGLLHPVLPYRSQNKLTFPLCPVCADERIQGECQHTDEERAFWGTWVTLEIYKALDCGYQILDVSEVWHYSEWAQYDEETGSKGLFTDYINCFLKLKQQASDWPGWVKTEADKDQYIRDYEEREGIKLDPKEIEKNEGLRQLAKLCLNSFWGKFGQRNNMTKMVYCKDPALYFELVFDPTNEVTAIKMIGDDTVAVTYRKCELFAEALPNTSPVIAAYVTCQARLKLLSYLEQLEERVLYFDTDSVVYVSRPGDTFEPPTGDFLGDLTDELSGYGPGSYIHEFISGGPKQYGMKIWSTNEEKYKYVVKLRGFTINATTANVLNYKNLRRLVKTFVRSGARDELKVVIRRIEKNSDRQVFTTTTRKTYRTVYDKRRVLRDGSTLPYGY